VARLTFDFGIDLGTTNSAIALVEPGAQPEVIANNDNERITPSVVGVGRNGQLRVGKRAYSMTASTRHDEQQNVAKEFKRQMGAAEDTMFTRLQRSLRPEELSAEVLKELRTSVQRKRGEEIAAAVITIPAAFQQPQVAATKRAAEMAGFAACDLLQEPVAAALAYGFLESEADGYWIVYDLGGGTFDVALLELRDGLVRVANHSGDNFLGGKDIDNLILDRILLPAIADEMGLHDFHRGNERLKYAIPPIRYHAEQSKIELSRSGNAEIYIDTTVQDMDGQSIEIQGVEYELTRDEVDPLVESIVARSVNTVRDLLTESHVSAGAIEKLILVGGPTQYYLFRDALASEFGIALEHTIDPMTVVAQGAAVFASTRKKPAKAVPSKQRTAGAIQITLEYEPSGSDAQPDIGGTFDIPDGDDARTYSIELVNARTQWRSGKLPLAPNGAFLVTVSAARGANSFDVELTNAQGSLVPTVPDVIEYTMTTIEAPQKTLIHSILIGQADGSGRALLKKGDTLPAERSRLTVTADHTVKQGSDDSLRIKIYEGENVRKASRNILIGEVVVPAADFPRDLPAGAEIEVAIRLDETGNISGEAEVLMFDLDEPYPVTWHSDGIFGSVDAGHLRRESARVQQRIAELESLATKDSLAAEVFDRIEAEDTLEQVQDTLSAAKNERDQARKCQTLVMRLNQQLDEIEAKRERPELEQRLKEALNHAQQLVAEDTSGRYTQQLEVLQKEANQALGDPDSQPVVQAAERVEGFVQFMLSQRVEYWVWGAQFAEEHRAEMTDQRKADLLLRQAQKAMEDQDVDALKASVVQLLRLLPPERQSEAEDTGNVWVS